MLEQRIKNRLRMLLLVAGAACGVALIVKGFMLDTKVAGYVAAGAVVIIVDVLAWP